MVDLNCGCPVDKVTKDGSGSGMLKTPELIGEIISEMVAAVKIPVTVKIRAGWDEEHIVAPQVTRIAEQAGAKAICIHGRTRVQGYRGPANWDYIQECRKEAGISFSLEMATFLMLQLPKEFLNTQVAMPSSSLAERWANPGSLKTSTAIL